MTKGDRSSPKGNRAKDENAALRDTAGFSEEWKDVCDRASGGRATHKWKEDGVEEEEPAGQGVCAHACVHGRHVCTCMHAGEVCACVRAGEMWRGGMCAYVCMQGCVYAQVCM